MKQIVSKNLVLPILVLLVTVSAWANADDAGDDILAPESPDKDECFCPCLVKDVRNETTIDGKWTFFKKKKKKELCLCVKNNVWFEISGLTHNISSIFSDGQIHFVERNEWGARPPIKPLPDMENQPARYIVVTHTQTKSCFYRAQCLPLVRSIQDFQINFNDWIDIGPNFLVAGDGGVYIGRGWDKESANSHKLYKDSIDISFIGTYREEKPTEAQRETIKDLVDLGVREKKIQPNFKIWTMFT